LNVFYSPLILIQLISIWGTFTVCSKIDSKQRKIQDLENTLKDYNPQTKGIIKESILDSKVNIIKGKEHLAELYHSVKSAKTSLCILSGWLSVYIIDDKLLKAFSDACQRGVEIYIGYGWEDSKGRHSDSFSTQEAVKRLADCQSKSGKKLHLAKFANHEKILVKDNEYVVCGSNNWLSNRKFRNSERSLKIFSRELAESETKRISDLILSLQDSTAECQGSSEIDLI
jgi:phosphatidylserine/phosphatidylglycerophosphate/cardiolipin synthase-like enzyme